MQDDTSTQASVPNQADKTVKSEPRRKPGILKRYPLVIAAIVIGLAIIGGAGYYAFVRNDTNTGSFDPNSVLPPAVTQPQSTAVYNAESLKQYDGKDGRKCYVAVKGTVYEISGKSLWQEGQHTPSSGSAYCGADLTEAIKRSPHGESKLRDLPKVGTFQ